MNHLIGKKGLLASKVVVKGYQAPMCQECSAGCRSGCEHGCSGGCTGTAKGHIRSDNNNRTF